MKQSATRPSRVVKGEEIRSAAAGRAEMEIRFFGFNLLDLDCQRQSK
jgi:hypothetical protein